jgi:hypothetical protein
MRGSSVNTTTARRAAALLAALAAALLATLTMASPAHATAFRFWSYWQGATGQWVAAQTGPGDHTIVDEDVQGWRFAISTEAVDQAPDNAPDFATLCPDLAATAAPAGQLRVAVVIDSGFVADAPDGQAPPADAISCVTVPEGSTGNQALAAAAEVTGEGGLVCGINGYPTDECGAEVSDADAQAAAAAAASEEPNPAVPTGAEEQGTTDSTTSDSSALPLIVGGAAVAALLLAALLIVRRRNAEARSQGAPDAAP